MFLLPLNSPGGGSTQGCLIYRYLGRYKNSGDLERSCYSLRVRSDQSPLEEQLIEHIKLQHSKSV